MNKRQFLKLMAQNRLIFVQNLSHLETVVCSYTSKIVQQRMAENTDDANSPQNTNIRTLSLK